MTDLFGPILPAPAADTFVFDFTPQIGGVGTITTAEWLCEVDPASPVIDLTPGARILGTPSFSAGKTSALIGNMLDGTLYILQATVTLSDGRVLIDSASLHCTSAVVAPDPTAPLTVAEFRALFPAFADETTYPDAMIQIWLDMGLMMVNDSWGSMKKLGQGLWAAHEMAKMAMASNPKGSVSGLGGIVASKSVGPVSVSYDNNLGSSPEAGVYNMTMYGRQYYQMVKLFGMGPWQFGPPEPVSPMGSPWQGPINYLSGRDW